MSDQRGPIKIRLNKVFCEVFDDDAIEIFDEMTANDITEWDSLMHVVLVVAVEKEFGVRLNVEEVGKLKNVSEFMDILEAKSTR